MAVAYDEFGFRIDEPALETACQEYEVGFFAPKLKRREVRFNAYVAECPQFGNHARLKALCRKGIPHEHRKEVWTYCLGSRVRMRTQPGVFQRLVKQPISEKDAAIIDVDLPRTFAGHRIFQENGAARMRDILHAYVAFNPELGYCQSFNYIILILMIVMDDDELAFWSLVQMLQSSHLKLAEYYAPGMVAIRRDMKVLQRMLAKCAPRVHRCLLQADMDVSWVCTKWYHTLFSTCVPIRTVLRIWDVLFCEGWKCLFRIATAVFKLRQNEIVSMKSTDELLETLMNKDWLSSTVDHNQLLKQAFKLGTLKREVLISWREAEAALIEEEATRKKNRGHSVPAAANRRSRTRSEGAEKR